MHLFVDRPFEAEGKRERGRCVDLHRWLLDESTAQKALALCFGPGDLSLLLLLLPLPLLARFVPAAMMSCKSFTAMQFWRGGETLEGSDGRIHVYSWFDFSPDAPRFCLAVGEESGKETAFLVVRVRVAILRGPVRTILKEAWYLR